MSNLIPDRYNQINACLIGDAAARAIDSALYPRCVAGPVGSEG